jgi:hypothetical protein
MDTPAPGINPRAMRAVDIVDSTTLLNGRITRADRYSYRYGPISTKTEAFLANRSLEIYLDIVRERVSAPPSPSNLWRLSVTESLKLLPKKEAVSMSIQKFNLREWLVPPILVPAFLGLLIAGAVIIRW